MEVLVSSVLPLSSEYVLRQRADDIRSSDDALLLASYDASYSASYDALQDDDPFVSASSPADRRYE